MVTVEGGASTNGAKIQIHCAHHDIGNFKELFWTIEPTEYPHPQSGAQTTVDTMPADAEASQKDA
ncbi:hypothetical protein R3P38DRAFT_3219054 [Favolaschia claudopus]|uniref:Uncharacterized protein n=1 Tax=Favolaschia claudopus TaxID=2862362 RepID=A0AAW0A2I3_9AGAR